ncbi:MAG: hypothetical protein PHS61_00015 [Candidatus Omnitrophica bacterium]|nr:hypothetical protein [Candidatus Omnitrophota bacterium]
MKKKELVDKWFELSGKERKSIMSHWNVYNGDGEDIIKKVVVLFKNEFKGNKYIRNIGYAIYHGGDWIIDITLSWKYKEKIILPSHYYGFAVHMFYDSIPTKELEKMAKNHFEIWTKNIDSNFLKRIKNVSGFQNLSDGEIISVLWKMDGMSKYYNPFNNID